MTLEPMLALWSNPGANQILLCNIWSYSHCSKCTPLLSNALSLFRPWLPNISQKVTYLFCDWLNIDSKVLIGRVRQATRDVVKSEV